MGLDLQDPVTRGLGPLHTRLEFVSGRSKVTKIDENQAAIISKMK